MSYKLIKDKRQGINRYWETPRERRERKRDRRLLDKFRERGKKGCKMKWKRRDR